MEITVQISAALLVGSRRSEMVTSRTCETRDRNGCAFIVGASLIYGSKIGGRLVCDHTVSANRRVPSVNSELKCGNRGGRDLCVGGLLWNARLCVQDALTP